MSTQRRHWISAPRFSPLLGVVIGAAGGAVYWLGAQVWPASVAVVLSMLATEVMPTTHADQARVFGAAGFVFALLLKYSTLMALSAASLPFAVPANVALGLIMICGHAASRALAVSLAVWPDHDSPQPVRPTPISNGDLVFALAIGFAPAALLGIPGLIGLAAAVLARVALGTYLNRRRKTRVNAAFYATQQLTEVCFYLAALASWPFV